MSTGPADKTRLVLVLGVHRSGTSLMTAGLRALGCSIGEFDNRIGEENPKGFFEHPAPRAFNDRLMQMRGTSWKNWAYDATVDGLEDLEALQDEAASILAECFPGNGPFVLKDPRISTMLPFWEAAIRRMGWHVSRVLVVRDPAEVAVSQVRRAAANPKFHGMLRDGESMAALWVTTMRTILATLPDDQTLLVGTAGLYDRPVEILQACASFLELTPPLGAIEGFATNFLDSGLRRAQASGPAAPGWPSLAADLFAALRAPETPRPLPVDEARRVLSAQGGLANLMPLLRPVARAFAEADAALAQAQRETAALYAALGPIGVATAQGPATHALGRALEAAMTLRDTSPNHPALLALEARLREAAGQTATAEALWRQLVSRKPNSPFPLRGLAQLLRRRARNTEAEAVEAEILQRFPSPEERR